MADDLDPVWRALASPVRRAMLDALRGGPRTTSDLAAGLPELSRFAVMQHLGVLEAARLVVAVREGRERWNHLNPVPIRRIYERWVSRYDGIVAGELIALRRAAESPRPAKSPTRRARRGAARPRAERTP